MGSTKAATAARTMMMPMIMMGRTKGVEVDVVAGLMWGWTWDGSGSGCSGDAAGGGSIDTPVRSSRMTCGNHLHRKQVPSLCRGGDRQNLFLDGGTHFLGEQVHLFERFPARDGTFGGLDRNLPEWACRNSCCVGKAPHLVGCDSVKTAAAAE